MPVMRCPQNIQAGLKVSRVLSDGKQLHTELADDSLVLSELVWLDVVATSGNGHLIPAGGGSEATAR